MVFFPNYFRYDLNRFLLYDDFKYQLSISIGTIPWSINEYMCPCACVILTLFFMWYKKNFSLRFCWDEIT